MNDTRLFEAFRPRQYDLQITLERQERRFSGKVTIDGTMPADAECLVLHAHELRILSATIDGVAASLEQGEQDTLTLATEHLTAGDHRATVTFEGIITDAMHGLYPCYFTLDGRNEELLATQFESHHAREVFPCIDEPEAKATFDLTLTTEQNMTVVGNMPIKQQREVAGRLTTIFQTTPVMSTYLLAWVVGPLTYEEAVTKDGVVMRVYATPDKQRQLRFALDVATKILDFFNDYFAVAYPLPKCDLIALPDFSSSAMENWGCITFREASLLADEHTATNIKQYIVTVIAHELAHQWFGNLVTMRWWDDLWLNESFANWIEYLATDHLFPQWDIWTQYYADETALAVARDSLASVQKIQQEVRSPAEIHTLFDPAIVYAKGGSLLNMLHAYLGAATFQGGLRLYLQRHQYCNTEARDLWKSLGEVAGRDVIDFMTPWITQAGLPVVTVGSGSNSVNLHQQRFYSNPKHATGADQTIWPIPLLTNGQLTEQLLDQPSGSYQLRQSASPLLLNQGRNGYYLSLYDTEHLKRLASLVGDGRLSTIDRLGLLNDSLHLSKAGLHSYQNALQLLNSYRHESALPVWRTITAHFQTLKMFANTDEAQLRALRHYMHDFTSEQYQRLGWEPQPNETHADTLLRPMIIEHMAFAEDEEVIERLEQMVAAANAPADIWADLRKTACAATAAFNGESAFDTLLHWYRTTTAADERVQLAAGIAAARDPWLITRALELLTTDAVKSQDLFYWIVYLSRNRYACDLTWQWLQDHWQWIVDRYSGDLHYGDFPRHIAATFSTREQLIAYQQFFEPKRSEQGLTRTITQGIETIEARVLWRERDGQAVADYLRAYMSSNQPVTS